MIYISDNIVLDSGRRFTANNPRLCYSDVVRFSDLTVTSQEALYPITNVTNPSTDFFWSATSTDEQVIESIFPLRDIDYVGIARHNLTSAQLKIELLLQNDIWFNPFIDLDLPIEEQDPLVNIFSASSLLFLFTKYVAKGLRLTITSAQTAPKISVLMAGESLVLQRSIYVGHTPITYGRSRSMINGVSESGQYLGSILRRETLNTSVSMDNITPAWFRERLDPFFQTKPYAPFFWAWRPSRYPEEVGYCWLTGDPKVSNQRSNGMMSVSFSMEGL